MPAPAGGVRDVWYAFRATQAAHKVQLVEASTEFVMELRDGWGTGSQSLLCGVTAPSNYRVGRTVQLQASGLTVGKMYFLRLYPTSGFRPDSQNDDYRYERPVTFIHTGTQSRGFIDLYRARHFVMEAKQGTGKGREPEPDQLSLLGDELTKLRQGHGVRGTRRWDDTMLRARNQADGYARAVAREDGWQAPVRCR